jgi:hypothetical protein
VRNEKFAEQCLKQFEEKYGRKATPEEEAEIREFCDGLPDEESIQPPNQTNKEFVEWWFVNLEQGYGVKIPEQHKAEFRELWSVIPEPNEPIDGSVMQRVSSLLACKHS